jgi:hypothetical protein
MNPLEKGICPQILRTHAPHGSWATIPAQGLAPDFARLALHVGNLILSDDECLRGVLKREMQSGCKERHD